MSRRAVIRPRIVALYRAGRRPVEIAEQMDSAPQVIGTHLLKARSKGELPPLGSAEDMKITAAWRAPKPIQTAVPCTGSRELGVSQGALPGGGDSPPAASPGEKPGGAVADPPSAPLRIGKGTNRATTSAPAPLPGGAASTETADVPDKKTGDFPSLVGAAPADAQGGENPGAVITLTEGSRDALSLALAQPERLVLVVPAPAVDEIASIIELDVWLHQSNPGDICRYHRGELACSRSMLGAAALRLAERGLVELVQKRHGAGDTSYLAIRRKTEGRGQRTEDTRASRGRVGWSR